MPNTDIAKELQGIILDRSWENFKELSEIYHNEDAISFVGSGLSVDAGIPDWKSLLKELAEIIGIQDLDYNQHTEPILAGMIGVDESNETGELVRSFFLSQNFPNPFNPTTTIRYALPASAEVLLTIFSLRGEKVYRFASTQTAGYHEITWDGSRAVSGIYFYRLQAGDFVQTRKMVLLK